MKRAIFSIYIDIPADLLDAQPPHKGDTEDKNQKAKRQFANNFPWLLQRQEDYAAYIGADYIHYPDDEKYQLFRKEYHERYPFITEYNIVNFYKIHLMYELAEKYDEVLYLDMDVVPTTYDNFFEVWDLSKGIAIKQQAAKTWDTSLIKKREKLYEDIGHTGSIRSPDAKYWNARAMCLEYGKPYNDVPVYNTGIVGVNKYWLEKLDYFNNFDELLDDMKELKEDEDSMWPAFAHAMFGWDNETIWAIKCNMNDIPSQWLDGAWHCFLNVNVQIPTKAKLVHVIHKEFEEVRKWCEENNL